MAAATTTRTRSRSRSRGDGTATTTSTINQKKSSPASTSPRRRPRLWTSTNASKRWAETFFLAYSPFWMTWALCIVVPFEIYEVRRKKENEEFWKEREKGREKGRRRTRNPRESAFCLFFLFCNSSSHPLLVSLCLSLSLSLSLKKK